MSQFALPDADLSNGSFFGVPAAPLNLWQNLDDNSETDYIESSGWDAADAGVDSIQHSLSNVLDPGVSSGHILRLRWSAPTYNGSSYTVQIGLYQGAPFNGILIALSASVVSAAQATPTTLAYTLTAAEADSITDYTDLTISITIADNGGANAGDFRAYWAELEVPSTGPAIKKQPADVNVAVPNNATFSVEAATSGGSLSYQWQKQEAGVGGWSDVIGATSSTYTFASAGSDMRDRYRCNVTDANGTTTSNSALVTVRAYDIFLYAKAEADGVASNVWLRDPTQIAAAAITGTAASGQGGQTVDATALLQFIAAGVSGQGSQSASATALLQFIASAVSAQGGQSVAASASLDFTATAASAQGAQTVDAAELEQFVAAVASAQGSQSAAVAAQLVFIAVVVSAQGSETVDASGFNGVIISGDAASAQGGQTADALGAVADPVQIMDGGLPARIPNFAFSVPITGRRLADMLAQPAAIDGEAASAQGGQSAEGRGEVKLVPAVSGSVESEQALAEVIAIGEVDNRRPRNIKKMKLAAALLKLAA
jgi:hypothetical protein